MFAQKPNKNKIRALIDLRRSPEYILGVKKIINQEFDAIKNNFISEFNNHPVTREIEAGVGSANISGTLGGYGNLFSYIGFSAGDKPIQNIRNKFNEIFITNVNIKKDGSSIVFVSYPQPKDIFAVTPLPWAEGRSWAEGIERGLPGFGSYLNTETSKSRSGHGVQIKNSVRKGKFQNVKYISSLINEFEKDILSLNNKTF